MNKKYSIALDFKIGADVTEKSTVTYGFQGMDTKAQNEMSHTNVLSKIDVGGVHAE